MNQSGYEGMMQIHQKLARLGALLQCSILLFYGREASALSWQVQFSGFVELDTIVDSTRSLAEVVGNSPVALSSTVAGANGRTQFSMRNTRLALSIDPPVFSNWKTKGYLETDFLGFDPGSTGSHALNTEASLFNNPTLRIRHAYFQGSSAGFQLTVGQTWSLFGWQPYYFMTTANVSPLPGMLYGRTPLVRAMETLSFGSSSTFQVALSVQRPVQRDSGIPDLQAGMRLALNDRKAGFTGGAAGMIQTQPMSLGISSLIRDFSIPSMRASSLGSLTNFTGWAYAIDIMIPILASPDGKSVGNTLSLLGEFASGTGFGDQYVSWTGGTANPLNLAKDSVSAAVNLDGGIGDYDPTGTFHLIDLSSANLHFQYHLPESLQSFVNLGGAMLYSDNMNTLIPYQGSSSAGTNPYNRETVVFGNIFHYFTDQIRLGFEYAHIETTYADGTIGFNNRYQMTCLFIF